MWVIKVLLVPLFIHGFCQVLNGQGISVQPQQIRLSIYGDDDHSFVITWTTFNETTTQVECGLDPRHLDLTLTGSQELFIDGGPEHRRQFIHRVVVNGSGLTPLTAYYYRVGSPNYGWSDLFWFKTYPKGQDWSSRLAIYGDLGNVNGVSLPQLQEDTQQGLYDMIIHVGDFAYDMDWENGRRGDEFMRQIEPIAAYVPYMTCPGNHEPMYNFSNYKYRFSMPDGRDINKASQDKDMFYSFNLGPVHFISINSEAYYFLNYGLHPVIRQYNWLIQDLKEADLPENRSKRPWIVIYGHRPMYCSDADRDDCTKTTARTRIGLPLLHLFGLEELLLKYNVDLAIWAHEHDFERFWPVYDWKVFNGSFSQPYVNPRAPVHIVTGSAGCQEKHDSWLPLPEVTAFRSMDYGFTKLTAHNQTHLELQQVSVDKGGEIIDHIWIVNDKHKFSPHLVG